MKNLFTLVLGLLLTSSAMAGSPAATVGKAAPDFTLVSVTGDTVNLGDFMGKTVVLEWINYDCPFVKKHYNSGNMQKLQKEWMEKGVIWLAVCSSAPGKQGNFTKEEILLRMKNHQSSPSAYLIDESGTVGKMYGAKTTPHMYVINTNGTLEYAGAIDSNPSSDPEDIKTATNYVSAALASVLAGKSVEVKETKPYGCSVKY